MAIETTVPVGEVAILLGGGTPSRAHSDFFGNGIPWVTPTDLPPIGKVCSLCEVAESLTPSGLENSSAKILPPGAVLFSSRATIGKIAVANRQCCTNQGFINFIPKSDKLDSWYLAYLLLHFLPTITDLCGETTFKEVPRTKMRSLEIPVPSIEEQRRIVARIKECLSRVEEMQRLRVEATGDCTFLLSATLRELFDEAAASGEPTSIGAVTLSSQYGTNIKSSERIDGVPILRIPNVARGCVNLDKMKYAKLTGKEHAKIRLEAGDLLVVRTNGSPELVGRCAVFAEKGDFGYASYLIRFRLREEIVLPDYLSIFLRAPQGREAIARIRQTSAGQYNVNSENLRNIVFPLVRPEVQVEIVTKALAVQGSANSIREEFASTDRDADSLREAILREAFSGNL